MSDSKREDAAKAARAAMQKSTIRTLAGHPPIFPVLQEAKRIPPGMQAPRPVAAQADTTSQSKRAPAAVTPELPCLCPGEVYPISRAVCLVRQDKRYAKCPSCVHRGGARRGTSDNSREK